MYLDTARWAAACGPTGAQLAANIGHGRAFSHIYGTPRLLLDDLRQLLVGYVLSMFRGDAGLLAPGPQQFEELIGVPVAAVLPRVDHRLTEEDGWSIAARRTQSGGGSAAYQVAFVVYPRISNPDEFAPPAQAPDIHPRWVRSPEGFADVGLIVLPVFKQVSGDLQRLHGRAPASAIEARGPVLGVCGGL